MDEANIFAATWCLLLALTLGLPSNGLLDHEIDRAIISPRGALLCPIVEDFYSYSRSTAYGPAQWGGISECCNGHRQSPRNLLSNSPSVCGRLSGPQLWYNSTRKIMGNLYNNGHDPTVHFHNSDTAYLFNAPYTVGPYLLDNVHLHFCTSTPRGSEHAINGKFYNGEIHLVHFKESYGSLGGAVLHDDGIVVIGIMVQAVEPYNNNLNSEMVELIRRMGELQGVGKGYQIPVYVDISKIFPRSRAFFTYSGSLTSPPCSEAVQWINFLEPINISPHEMEILKRLPNNENGFISDSCNDRPLQSGNTVVESNLACAFNTGNGED